MMVNERRNTRQDFEINADIINIVRIVRQSTGDRITHKRLQRYRLHVAINNIKIYSII